MKQNKFLYSILAFGFLFAIGFSVFQSCQKESVETPALSREIPAELVPFEGVKEEAINDDLVITLKNGETRTLPGKARILELRDSVAQTDVDSICRAFHVKQFITQGGEFRQWKYFAFRGGWAKLYVQQSYIPILRYNTGEPWFNVWDSVFTFNDEIARLSH